MESNGNAKTSKIKSKKGAKDMKVEYPLPVQFCQEPAMKILPKVMNKTVIKNEPDDSDFPALPTGNYLQKNPVIELNANTSTSFSTIVARKQQVLSNINVVDFKNRNYSIAESSPLPLQRDSCGHATSSSSSKVSKTSDNHKHKTPFSTMDRTKLSDVKNTVPSVSATTSQSSKKTNPGNQAVRTEKKGKKKKANKASRTPQGKVNTLTQEQYQAFTEQSSSKPTESAFVANIEDLCEYPALGFPVSNNVTVQKEISGLSIKQEHADASENDQHENEDATSPSRLILQEGSSLSKPLTVSPKEEKAIPNKKFNAPIQMNLMDMLSKIKLKSTKKSPKLQTLNVKREKVKGPGKHGVLNALDSSGPTRKRGKEREVPRKPKLSKIKKVILKERVEKRLRLALLTMSRINGPECSTENTSEINNNQLLECEMQNLSLSDNHNVDESLPVSPVAELEPKGDVQIANLEEDHEENQRLKCAKKLLHCRKFREYCNHFISEEIDTLTNNLLAELVRYQDRLFLKDPVKARARKRFVCGLKEVTKNLKLRKLKLVIVAPDIEEINSEGGLNDALHCILDFCENYVTPLMFSLPRRKLGKVCKKKVPLSCVGIFNYEGTEDIYKQLMELVEEARQVYKQTLTFAQEHLTDEMIQILCDEKVDHGKVEEIRVLFWQSQGSE